MKIPNNKILAFGCATSIMVAVTCTYWIGRRDELNQIIALAKDADNLGFRSLKVIDNMKKAGKLLVRFEEI